MAYASVISLKRTIHRLLNFSRISIGPSSREILEFANSEVESLQKVLKRLDDTTSRSQRLNDLEGEIREAVNKLEDLLEFHESDQFLPKSESFGGEDILSLELEELREEISSFVETAKKLEKEYVEELAKPLPEQGDGAAVSSTIDFGVKRVGLSDEFTDIKNQLLKCTRPDDFAICSIVGIKGSGRTLTAKSIFDDLFIGKEEYFERGAWVTVGPDYQFKEILLCMLSQLFDLDKDDKFLVSEGDEKLGQYLYRVLKGGRYMIVLDDVCDTQIWDYLRSSFPKQHNGSLILLTTSKREVAVFANSDYIYQLPFYSENRIWHALRTGFFLRESCPPEFESAGKEIAQNCEGANTLAIAKVMLFLLKAGKMPEYWNKIAADTRNSLFVVVDEISETRKIKEDLQQYKSFPDDDERALIIHIASEILDLSYLIKSIKKKIFPKRLLPKMEIMSFCGMAGIGKTALAKEIFENQAVISHFDHRAWITLGPKYQAKEILADILSQIYPNIDKIRIKGDARWAKHLCTKLSRRRCFIVLDDLWNKESLHYLEQSYPNIKGKALVTTRLAKVAKFDKVHKMHLLNKEDSWCLLRQKVFAEDSCPPELEMAGKRISENCEGLPLLILTVANLLSRAKKTPEYWNKVAKNETSLFTEAHDQLSKVLSPSYEYLPQPFKPCFLYMGVFPQRYEIPTSKLSKLWTSEGFLEPHLSKTVEDFVAKCLSELNDRSLIMVCLKGSNLGIKTCRLHSVFWHLGNSEGVKNEFFYAFNTYANNSIEDIKSQRRLCIRNNILLGIKDVQDSITSIPTARSLLCIGPPQQYPTPIYFELRLLRVLDALNIRFYKFPTEIVELIHLRYLALTCNEKLPASISKLWNLQCLIVGRHLSIKSSEDSLYLPIEIWGMKELKHLQIMGRRLPNPSCGALLPNLLTLLNLSAHSCTKEVLEGIPNLKRLGIQIELAPNDDGKSFHYLNHISCLSKLESLKCIVVNPELSSKVVAPPAPISMFPPSLKKLSLSGLGYPWEYMSIIGNLENLQVLKLRCYAFRGPEWIIEEWSFEELKFFLIEDTDLVHWEMKLFSFPDLKCLSIKHCYKLEKIPECLHRDAEMIEVVDCNPLVALCAKQLKEKHFKGPLDNEIKLQVQFSWDADRIEQ